MNLYWLQAGGCSGDTMSFLNCECNLFELLENLQIEVLYHPSLSNISYKQHKELLDNIIEGKKELDILCVEGNVVRGPNNTGMFDTLFGKPKKDFILKLAKRAKYVIAVGTCASFGGFGRGEEMDGIGLQFDGNKRGGFLGEKFLSISGYPVINLPGCPIHPKALSIVLEEIVNNIELELTNMQTIEEIYTYTVHQGCTRNEYHEYKVEERNFGERGCMFFHLGCKGPITLSSCNKYLWNEVNSKTRAGIPCFGCARADFPQKTPFFKTENIVGTPVELPYGVDRAHYLAYKDMAAIAAPDRLKKRKQRV